MRILQSVFFSFLTLLTLSGCYAQPSSDSRPAEEPVAEVNGSPINHSELEQAATSALDSLRVERLRFDAQQVRKRQEILETQLDELIASRVLELEASSQQITKDELLQREVNSKVAEPGDEEVAKFYEENKQRIRGTLEQVGPQIKNFLSQRQSQELYGTYIASLREKYGVKELLKPLRIEVETAGFPSKGPADAPVTIVEFSDFQCPYCSNFNGVLEEVNKNYGDKVRIVFRQFPLSTIHPQAQKAAEASLCAADQGRFWELHDAMFKDQKKLSVPDLKSTAETLGLNVSEFEACVDSGKFAARVLEDVDAGSAAGVSGTPAIFINGRPLSGAVPYEQISKVVEEELAGRQ